jgi:hypothetical protein
VENTLHALQLIEFSKHISDCLGNGNIGSHSWIGRLHPGATGSTIKSRAAGQIIRYNMIESSSRALDLVDVEDAVDIIAKHQNS